MNLILFEAPFEQLKLSANDPRTRHILTVLKIELGGVFMLDLLIAKGLWQKLRLSTKMVPFF